MPTKPKLLRACTVPQSLGFVKGMIPDLVQEYELVLLSSPGTEWEEIREKYPEVKCIEVPMERHISSMKDLAALWKIYRVFRKERPRMVHSMTPKAGLLCMMAAWMARVPRRIHTFTGLVFPTATGLKRKVLMLTDWLTCACATHVIPEGEGVKNDLQDNGITHKPMEVLGYGNVRGIDLERFKPRERYGLAGLGADVNGDRPEPKNESRFTFIFVGRLVGDKGINELVEAFVRLNKERPATRLILVGPEESELDPLKASTRQMIQVCQAIEAVGSQPDVRPWFAAADAAILPSYREGFPNVVIEAGAMGLPQIVTDINGSREIIIEGRNGTIVPPRNADALYEAMKRFVDNPEYVKSLAANARPMIASRYEQGFVRACLYEFYKKL